GSGHIMKLRYTPFQGRVFSSEEEGSPHNDTMEKFDGLYGNPVIIGELHSMVAPTACALRKLKPEAKIAYIMTDGACLPIAFSNTVRTLKEKKIIDATVTCGNAFGGDFEAVTKYSALALAASSLNADFIIVAMGVGIAGTGTALGHTGLEVGEWVNATAALKGTPIVIPRLGFADKRERHKGISHHTINALALAALAKAIVALPKLEFEEQEFIDRQLINSKISEKHEIVYEQGEIGIEGIDEYGIKVKTMGRGPEEEPAFFLACGAAAVKAVNIRI
ncbi:MAG TPA: DUF3866 family protein, partial [bacterium]|nr:DUF3866 family protein [bacterium]